MTSKGHRYYDRDRAESCESTWLEQIVPRDIACKSATVSVTKNCESYIVSAEFTMTQHATNLYKWILAYDGSHRSICPRFESCHYLRKSYLKMESQERSEKMLRNAVKIAYTFRESRSRSATTCANAHIIYALFPKITLFSMEHFGELKLAHQNDAKERGRSKSEL